MRKILATIAVAAMSTTAFAAGNVDLRGDFYGTSLYKDATNTNRAGVGGLSATRARLGFSGKVSESASAKVQLDMLSATLLKYGEMTHKWNDMFSVTVGKLEDAGTGGYEAARTTADQYFTSASYMKNYPLGVDFDFTFAPGNLKVALVNEAWGIGTTGASGTISQTSTSTGMGYGLNWDGKAGAFDYQVSYHSVPQSGAASASTYANTYMVLAGMYKMDALKVSLDYLSNTYQKASNSGLKDGTKSSIVAMVDYDMGAWVPQLKFESSTLTNLATTLTDANDSTGAVSQFYNGTVGVSDYTSAISQFSVGTEYKPNVGESMRYHVMYVSKTAALSGAGWTGNANSSISTSAVFAGIRVLTDFAK